MDISIIGAGKVGTAVGVLAARAGWRVKGVASRTLGSAQDAAKQIGRGASPCNAPGAATMAELVLLAVPDDAIVGACEELVAADVLKSGTIVAHCSGTLTSEALKPAAQRGCSVGSMHPLQTFPTVPAAIDAMPGSYCFIEGDAKTVEALKALAEAIGGTPVAITPETKLLYHAAAVIACNYLTTLLGAAVELGNRAGVERQTMLKALEPIVRATVDNVFKLGLEEALTGPIARGDVGVVRRHVEGIAVAGDESLSALYAVMGAMTVELARRKKTIDVAEATKLLAALCPDNPVRNDESDNKND